MKLDIASQSLAEANPAPVSPGDVVVPGMEYLKGAIDSHVHCCPHINLRTVSLFDAVRAAAQAGLSGLGLMDVFSNTSGLAALANYELGYLGVDVFGGIILEPYVGGLSPRTVSTALGMSYGTGGARFVSLPCHHTAFVARSEGRSPAYVETCLAIPLVGELPDPLPEIIDQCIDADVLFNFGHLSGPELVRLAEEASKRGCRLMLCPAGYLEADEAAAIVAAGAVLEYSFFVFSHATSVSQTMIDAEPHRFPRADFDRAVSIISQLGAENFVISSDSGAVVLAPPVDAFRQFIMMLISSGITSEQIATMATENPARLFKVARPGNPAPGGRS